MVMALPRCRRRARPLQAPRESEAPARQASRLGAQLLKQRPGIFQLRCRSSEVPKPVEGAKLWHEARCLIGARGDSSGQFVTTTQALTVTKTLDRTPRYLAELARHQLSGWWVRS